MMYIGGDDSHKNDGDYNAICVYYAWSTSPSGISDGSRWLADAFSLAGVCGSKRQ